MAQGTLYLCATPIGNLGDMSPRIRETLSQVDLIACEDTRNSIRLLNHFEIHTPMTSYHEYNKVEKAYALIEKMKEGADIALITDAGTPAISDPGEVLVKDVSGSRHYRYFPARSCRLHHGAYSVRSANEEILF